MLLATVVRMDNSEDSSERPTGCGVRPGTVFGVVAGAVFGVVVVLLAGTAFAQHLVSHTPEPLLEATHLPPLLTRPGERVDLRYDAFCVFSEGAPDTACDAEGAVFVRPGDTGPFHELALRESGGAADARLGAVVPPAIARAAGGFSYYAVLRSRTTGASATLPAGGAAAPMRSLAPEHYVDVELGRHAFGRTRSATARVAHARWGDGPSQAGLEQGAGRSAIGGSSFDVSRDGTVHVLDEANKRVLRWRAGANVPQLVPLSINGTLADLSVADDGTLYVLETTAEGGRAPLLRTIAADGAPRATVEMAESASQVRVGPDGPVVLQNESGQWRPAADGNGVLGPAAQTILGRSGRPLRGSDEVVVLRRHSEVRVAVVGVGGVRRAWRVSSDTPLAEVQLAEPVGDRLVLVVRVYSDARDEFAVLLLGDRGVDTSFSVSSSDWAETAPVSRFRVAGSSVYQLGSTRSGLFVDRFDLEVK
jgi:hypothetical protein